MRILVACEESQVVTSAFRRRGHEAFSCDLKPCSGGHPEWHIQGDVSLLLKEKWDMIIAHPECTHLAVSGAHLFKIKKADGRQQKAIDFFMMFVNHPCLKKCIENPVGIMSTIYKKPTQIIQPYEFGDDASKKTCLWLTGLPPLLPTSRVFGRIVNGKERWSNQTGSGQNKLGPSKDRAEKRSVTYKGIAEAMASQWGDV